MYANSNKLITKRINYIKLERGQGYMKIAIKKHFNTLIITKRTIILSVCSILLFFVFVFMFKNSQDDLSNQYTSTEDFHNIMISSELNTDVPSKYSIKEFLCDLIGFDITNPQTILYDYSSQFSQIRNTSNPADTIYPQQEKKEETKEQKIKEQQLPIEEVSIAKGLSVSNSSNKSVDINQLVSEPLSFSINSDEPQILIVHTHTTESYTDSGKTKYTASDSDRSTDSSKNMIAVGNALTDVLNERGIKTIHDTTVHDYPAYNGSYERCKATVLKNLSKYPSIKMVLDVHRDGIIRSDGTKVKVSSEVEGNKTAQCMFVVGTNSELTHDNWQENLKLAAKIQNKANQMYPDFMRPINLRSERFNQQLSKGSIIIEVGSNGNTLNEAVYSAKLMGNVIASLFEK